jgi:hypothetical protein
MTGNYRHPTFTWVAGVFKVSAEKGPYCSSLEPQDYRSVIRGSIDNGLAILFFDAMPSNPNHLQSRSRTKTHLM